MSIATAVHPDMNPAVLSVASTLMSEMGFGTPNNTEFPLEWELETDNSQVRLMYEVVSDVLVAIERLQEQYGDGLKTDLVMYATRKLASLLELNGELEDNDGRV